MDIGTWVIVGIGLVPCGLFAWVGWRDHLVQKAFRDAAEWRKSHPDEPHNYNEAVVKREITAMLR